MGVKKHYGQHLAHFYSWMLNDFAGMKDDFAAFCQRQEIRDAFSGGAIDRGAGSGVQNKPNGDSGFWRWISALGCWTNCRPAERNYPLRLSMRISEMYELPSSESRVDCLLR